jgi:hypothetical protein
MASSKKATLSDTIAERRVKKRTSIGNSTHSAYKGKHGKKKSYRGQGR